MDKIKKQKFTSDDKASFFRSFLGDSSDVVQTDTILQKKEKKSKDKSTKRRGKEKNLLHKFSCY